MQGCAPGKIILSGEHSVVYGAPAVACAIQLYSFIDYTPIKGSDLIAEFIGIKVHSNHPIAKLTPLVSFLDRQFQKFVDGAIQVDKILSSPVQLVLYVLASQLPAQSLSAHFNGDSQLPIGAGMGSSASIIAAAVVLVESINKKPLSPVERYKLVKHCERLQHGKGSLIDAATVILGGAVKVQEQQVDKLSLRLNDNWYWLFTGTPQCSTGECVSFVAKEHGQDAPLWQAFASCTQMMIEALQAGKDPSEIIAQNQQLLEHIGVVSKRTQSIIRTLKDRGGTAKVSGAGAYIGDSSGLLLVYAPNNSAEQLFAGFNMKWGKVAQDMQGARVISEDV
ncbi:MAG: mevalonate kinase [Oceanospirillaceae bacterium]|jgi:mevalonate kinase